MPTQQEIAEHDAWFRAKVQEALDDPRPAIPDEVVEAYFTKRKEALLAKCGDVK